MEIDLTPLLQCAGRLTFHKIIFKIWPVWRSSDQVVKSTDMFHPIFFLSVSDCLGHQLTQTAEVWFGGTGSIQVAAIFNWQKQKFHQKSAETDGHFYLHKWQKIVSGLLTFTNWYSDTLQYLPLNTKEDSRKRWLVWSIHINIEILDSFSECQKFQ